MNNRRDFLKQSLLSAGTLAALNSPKLMAAPAKAPTRFIFMHRGNGLWPRVCVPPSLDAKTMEREKRKEAIDVDLDGHDLPKWLGPLAAHRENLTILQGLSGKMCTYQPTTPGARHWVCSRPMNASALSSGPRSISNWPSSFHHPPATLSWPVFRSAAAMPAVASTACPQVFPHTVRNNPTMPSARHASRELFKSVSSDPKRERNIRRSAVTSSSPTAKARSLSF